MKTILKGSKLMRVVNLFIIVSFIIAPIYPAFAEDTIITPTKEKASFSRALREGMKGEDVMKIQEFLGIKTDGSYGPATVSKVKEWQIFNNLNSDGVFGSSSFKKAGFDFSIIKNETISSNGVSGFVRDPNWDMPYLKDAGGNIISATDNLSPIDLNGDGLNDLVTSYGGGVTGNFENDEGSPYNDQYNTVFINTGKGFVRDPNWAMPYFKNNKNEYSPLSLTSEFFVNLNSDNLPDLIIKNDGNLMILDSKQVAMFINTGKSFIPDPNWTLSSEFYENYLKRSTNNYIKFIDLNGDKLTDVYINDQGHYNNFENDGGSPYNDQYNTVFINTGKGFVRDPNWDMPYIDNYAGRNFPTPIYALIVWLFEQNSKFIDVNNDGLVDFVSICESCSSIEDNSGILHNNPANTVFINTGKGFVRDPNWAMPYNNEGYPVDLDDSLKLIDITGDGLVDGILMNGGEINDNDLSKHNSLANTVFINTGKGFVRDPNWAMPYAYLNKKPHYFLFVQGNFNDVNNDKLIDYVADSFDSKFENDGGSPYNDQYNTVFINTGKGFVRDPNWDMPYINKNDGNYSIMFNNINYDIADVNGDKISDIIIRGNGNYDNTKFFQNDGGSAYNDATKTVFISTHKK